eukprot:883823-Pleurochrysis_carterae.AAC.3
MAEWLRVCVAAWLRDCVAPWLRNGMAARVCSALFTGSSKLSKILTMFGWSSERWMSISCRSSCSSTSSAPSSTTVFIANTSLLRRPTTVQTEP